MSFRAIVEKSLKPNKLKGSLHRACTELAEVVEMTVKIMI